MDIEEQIAQQLLNGIKEDMTEWTYDDDVCRLVPILPNYTCRRCEYVDTLCKYCPYYITNDSEDELECLQQE